MFLDRVGVRYGWSRPWVLRLVNATIAPGQVVIAQGSNGAGKSTLLKVCAGVLRPARGRVVDRPKIVGWVPERFPTAQPFTVEAYLLRMGRMRGLSLASAQAAVNVWSQRLHLDPFLGTRLADLSKGSAQKVGLAQGLLVRPGLLVLDEPWDGLDEATRAEVPAIVAEVVEAGGSVLLSDHRGETARLPRATSWLVRDGQVVQPEASTQDRCLLEIEVAADQVTATMSSLQAAGHIVTGVRTR